MHKHLVALFTIVYLALSGAQAAEKVSTPSERFYGKIVSIDHAERQLTVHNNRKKSDATFHWDEQTGVIMNRETVKPTELKVGQSLIVSYVMESDQNKAKRITVRTPFQKSRP